MFEGEHMQHKGNAAIETVLTFIQSIETSSLLYFSYFFKSASAPMMVEVHGVNERGVSAREKA